MTGALAYPRPANAAWGFASMIDVLQSTIQSLQNQVLALQKKLTELVKTKNSEEKTIAILSPNGGVTWRVGETQRITWTSAGIKSVELYLYDDRISGSGAIVAYITPVGKSVPASQGYYDWKIPESVLQANDGKNFKVVVQDINDHRLAAPSAASFKVVSLTQVVPTGKTGLRVSLTTEIDRVPLGGYTVNVTPPGCIDKTMISKKTGSDGVVFFNLDPGRYCVDVATPPSNKPLLVSRVGSYDFNVVENKITEKKFITEYNYAMGPDSNETPISVIVFPNGGETLKRGQNYSIQWSSAILPKDTKVSIYLLKEGVSGGETIVSGLPWNISGFYSWTPLKIYPFDVESPGTNQYRIEIKPYIPNVGILHDSVIQSAAPFSLVQ